MRLVSSQTVFPCDEHGEVAVPIARLLVNGELDIYPEVAGRGFFDIDYRKGALVLRATRFVGLIPISDRVAIHVRPKVPIPNLLWLVWRSGTSMSRLEGVIRGYMTSLSSVDSPESLYLNVFLAALRNATKEGPLKRFQSRTATNEWRGRFSVNLSVRRHYSRGLRFKHEFLPTDLTVNNRENQVLKHTAERLLQHLVSQGAGRNHRLAAEISRLLQPLTMVQATGVHPGIVARETPKLIRALPASRQSYVGALWLAYLIATRSVVTMERVGSARFESVLIDVSAVFESYVRQVCIERRQDLLKCNVLDGNKNPITLLTKGHTLSVSPDIYFTRGGSTLLVADAKYKHAPQREDRYEILAHCEASRARRAVFICPAVGIEPRLSLYGVTKGGIELYELRLKLDAADLRQEEIEFVTAIRDLLSRTQAELIS